MTENDVIRSYRDLNVWQLGMEIVERVYHISGKFPKAEQYGLTSQFRRAAISIPANIAEGNASAFTKLYQRHLSIAVGSLAELETYLELAKRLRFGNRQVLDELSDVLDQERRMLRGLQRSLREKRSSLTPDP
jgi:four helix bundle protein